MVTANKKPEQLLDLSKDKINITVKLLNEKEYQFANFSDFGVLQQNELTRLSRSLTKAGNIKTKKDEEVYNNVLLDMLSIMLPTAPRKNLQELSINDKLRSVNHYLEKNDMIKKKVTPLKKGPRAKKKKR